MPTRTTWTNRARTEGRKGWNRMRSAVGALMRRRAPEGARTTGERSHRPLRRLRVTCARVLRKLGARLPDRIGPWQLSRRQKRILLWAGLAVLLILVGGVLGAGGSGGGSAGAGYGGALSSYDRTGIHVNPNGVLNHNGRSVTFGD